MTEESTKPSADEKPDDIPHPQVPGDNRMQADRDRYPNVEDQPEMPISREGVRGTQLVHPDKVEGNEPDKE